MLLKSINYWSLPGGLEGTLPLERFIQLAHFYDYEAIELCVGEAGDALGLDSDERRCKEIRARAEDAGVPCLSVASGLYWRYALASPTLHDRERAVDALKKMIRITAWLGARTLLTIPGAVDIFFQQDSPVLSYGQVFDASRDGIKRVVELAEKLEVHLGIENVWNKFLLSPLEMTQFVDSFDSPSVGVYLDVANVLPYGYPQQWARILGKRVVGIHFKDFRRAVGTIHGFVDLLEGDVDWPEVMAAITEIGYSGPLVAEMIPLYRHYPETRVANTSRAMNAILSRTSETAVREP